jgi:hypothetical protein
MACFLTVLKFIGYPSPFFLVSEENFGIHP